MIRLNDRLFPGLQEQGTALLDFASIIQVTIIHRSKSATVCHAQFPSTLSPEQVDAIFEILEERKIG